MRSDIKSGAYAYKITTNRKRLRQVPMWYLARDITVFQTWIRVIMDVSKIKKELI